VCSGRSDTRASIEMATCPVNHDKDSSASTALKDKKPAIDSCPIANPEYAKDKKPANDTCQVSANEGLNPANYMPEIPEQQTWPGQSIPLDTNRTTSTIPKGSVVPPHQTSVAESPAWVYPSEQQFFNAMRRKGFDAKEQDMKSVVAIHNAVNERTWNEVMKWEQKFHSEHCKEPKLVKFMGRPKDMSPKARFLTLFLGYIEPFDRHDWIVDRCGTEQRYVVDFYRGKLSANDGKPIAFHIDARPALDSFQSLKDRVRMLISDWC
jgi:cytochrome c heme-lyase